MVHTTPVDVFAFTTNLSVLLVVRYDNSVKLDLFVGKDKLEIQYLGVIQRIQTTARRIIASILPS